MKDDSRRSARQTALGAPAERNDPRNIADRERIVSVVAGAGLIAFGATRRPATALAAVAAGAGLIARGVTGRSAVYRAAHIDTRDPDTRRVLSGPGGLHVMRTLLINRPVHDVYAYWRDLRNLPRFMSHLVEVTPLDGQHSHWVTRGPAGTRIEWDAEIINEVTDKVLGWRSLPGSDVVSAGSVNFRERRGWGTEVRVKLKYESAAGRPGAWLARLLGADPSRTIHEDMRRLKSSLEVGEWPSIAGQPHGGAHPGEYEHEHAHVHTGSDPPLDSQAQSQGEPVWEPGPATRSAGAGWSGPPRRSAAAGSEPGAAGFVGSGWNEWTA